MRSASVFAVLSCSIAAVGCSTSTGAPGAGFAVLALVAAFAAMRLAR